MISRLTVFFLLFSFIECFSCKKHQIAEEVDDNLSITYCPICLKKYQYHWHYFINFVQRKNKHIAESYYSQYTPLNFIKKTIHKNSSTFHIENLFVEFANALWYKLSYEDYYFKNPDFENFFLSLFNQEKILLDTEQYKDVANLYRSIQLLYLALFYQCKSEFKIKHTAKIRLLLTSLDYKIKHFNIQYSFQQNLPNEAENKEELQLNP